MEDKNETKRYNLSMSQKNFNDLQEIAKQEHTTMLELITTAIKLWLRFYKASKRGATIHLKEKDGTEKELLII